MQYSKYERPDGYSKGDPIVYVRKNVVSDIGMPTVDYDGLYELFHGDLGVPTDHQPKAKLYGGSLGKRAWRGFCGDTVSPDHISGFHIAYTNTIHVNASATERRGSTMSIFVHEAQHLADSRNFPLARAIEIGIGVAAMKTGAAIADVTGFIPDVVGALVARQAWYSVQPAEKRAREAQSSDIFLRHRNDIVFPNRNS